MALVKAPMPPARQPSADSAARYLPQRRSLASLRLAAHGCHGCPLWEHATQTVFGSGSRHAQIMLVGEQPGDEEDRDGRPFVGPAGRILDQALAAASIARRDTYITNIVKHFKWVAHGKRRLHQKPNSREIGACLPWLDAEIELIKPAVLICLGATAAQAIIGPTFRVTRERGQARATPYAEQTLATVHPSAILRQPTSAARHAEMDGLVRDLKTAAELLRGR